MNETVVRIYKELPSHHFELMIGTFLSEFGGVCPSVGDHIATWLTGDPFTYYIVRSRCFIDARGRDRGWALVVHEVKPSPPLENLLEDWLADTKFIRECEESDEDEDVPVTAPATSGAATAEKLDRSNRDPAYWTPERKEILRREREATVAALKTGKTRRPNGK